MDSVLKKLGITILAVSVIMIICYQFAGEYHSSSMAHAKRELLALI